MARLIVLSMPKRQSGVSQEEACVTQLYSLEANKRASRYVYGEGAIGKTRRLLVCKIKAMMGGEEPLKAILDIKPGTRDALGINT